MDISLNGTRISCEQVYNIWATEPYLVRVLDLRPLSDFKAAHIPGAENIHPDQIVKELSVLGNRLAVIIAPENMEFSLYKLLGNRRDYVFLSQCDRWRELNKPLAGENINFSITNIKEGKGISMGNDIIFHQLFEAESSTYTYIIADKKTKEAAIIDPVLETVDRDLKLIEELGLRLMYVLDTHIHADHITGAGEIRKRTQAKTAVSQKAEISCVDIPLEDGQELLLGDKKIKVIATPGHTNTCMTYSFEGALFTGDALLIRGCGRTDFQQGSTEKLYESVHEKLFKLSDETLVYPGHDYRGQTSSTIGLEKKFNPRLGESKSKEDFKKIMSELKLANPKKIHEAVPANLACGQPKEIRTIRPQVVDGIPEVSCEDISAHLPQVETKKIRLIDVRTPEEFNNEYGHVQGAELVTLGPELTNFLEKGDRSEEIIFICRSGGRSATATAESINLGYKFTINMVGGMIRWNEKKFPVKRNSF
jgi:glyoxylase-like metal-dependent hydrolase (beta-lactamase superfamily II)/rhodanese-related sulfurtransferase